MNRLLPRLHMLAVMACLAILLGCSDRTVLAAALFGFAVPHPNRTISLLVRCYKAIRAAEKESEIESPKN